MFVMSRVGDIVRECVAFMLIIVLVSSLNETCFFLFFSSSLSSYCN